MQLLTINVSCCSALQMQQPIQRWQTAPGALLQKCACRQPNTLWSWGRTRPRYCYLCSSGVGLGPEHLTTATREIITIYLQQSEQRNKPGAVNALLMEAVNKANQPVNRQLGAWPAIATGDGKLQHSALLNAEPFHRCIHAPVFWTLWGYRKILS